MGNLKLPSYKKGDKLKILRNKVGGGKEEIDVVFESYIPQSNRFYCIFKSYKFSLELSKIILEEPKEVEGVQEVLKSLESDEKVKTDIVKKEPIMKVSKKPVLTEKKPTKTQRIISLLARKIDVKEIQTITENKYMPSQFFDAFKAFDAGVSFVEYTKDFKGLKAGTMEKHYITYKILRDGK